MGESIELHPAELAYVFSYLKAAKVVGWGAEPFRPRGDEDEWFRTGRDRLQASGRLVPGKQPGRWRFAEAFVGATVALTDPQLVVLAQRREGEGVRTLTVHVHDTDVIGLARRPDGTFELTRHPSFEAAVGAATTFAGAAPRPLERDVRIEANHAVLSKIHALADAGRVDKVVPALVRLGASEPDAKSAVLALARPSAAGAVSVLYCTANDVRDVETFSVLTNAHEHTWVVFPPADVDGPMVLERSSAGALSARVLVTIAARASLPA